MTIYPFEIDSDQNIIRVDDNITEVGGESINQLRDAVFAIEKELGIGPSGSAGSVSNRLNVALNPDGSIRASALTSIGLATLPIVDNQVAVNAGIKEYKLSLDFTTSDLHTLIVSNSALLSSLTAFANTTFSDLNLHIAGATFRIDGLTSARHVLSHIDINNVPNDPRDPAFTWEGLKDKTGTLRGASQAAQALQQINDDLVNHENAVLNAHIATAISVDTGEFTEIPTAADTAQKVFDYLDDAEVLNMGQHRATQHANAIPRISRSQSPILPDGYRENVVQPTPVFTYLIHPPNTGPVDDLSVGDDIIKFIPITNANSVFDAQFSQVRVGDVIRVNYGNGIEVLFPVESVRYTPGTEWIVRINGVNLFEKVDGYASARIDRAVFDVNTVGVLAVASANASSSGDSSFFTNILQSTIVGNPRGATAYGLGFDPGQLNSSHYNLYLEMYPTGNPTDRVVALPAIDVTANTGTTPGRYDLNGVVENINNKFRENGFNYRFIAFAHAGEVGIMLADAINNVSFAIINGSNSSGTLVTGIYTNNVIGGNALDDFDALGFGSLGADIASPAYQATWSDATAAQIPTKIIVPLKNRNYIVNGQRRDTFAPTYLANADGYWDGYISARTEVGAFTVEVTYVINLDLSASKLKSGKTIVIQPAIAFTDSLYSDVDYGRFIIKNVTFISCPPGSERTEITVINGIHGTGSGFGFSSLPQLPVRIYFGEDSVGFDTEEVIDQVPTPAEYHRLHEIYINDRGITFSHERARLPRQVEDPHKLSTDNLHIVSVSPKLRGYRGGNPLLFNKFVRFYLLSYNSTSGEFDGYLGQIAGTNNIIRVGPTVTGRKNVVTRFYDETNIDYIDLVFKEKAVSPGVNLLSTAVSRYVDIELFSSLQLDVELFLLASCEVNWQPGVGQFVIQNVNDLRQFGSINETNFTDSAIDFISAGDRLLHTNGVVRGLELDSISTVPDSGEIFFKGGVALVNGRIATVNNMSVTIPLIANVASGLPQTLNWAVCVNEDNNLVPILVTTTKTQFFATPGSGNYYIPSVTFSELVTTRKDLTVIALVNVTIASLTINSVTDVRRFVTSDNYSNTLTITSPEIPGSFHSFDTVSKWLKQLGGERSIVKVSGTFDIDITPINLQGFTNAVVFEGDGTIFNVTIGQGILLGSNVTLRNIIFTYAPNGLTYTPNDLVNSGNGCIYSNGTLSNFYIEKCKFTTNIVGTQRPPFINIELSVGTGITKSFIRENEFIDGSATANMAAIAVINNNGGFGNAAFVSNLIIEGNRCTGLTSQTFQGIYVTSISGASAQERPGLNSFNSIIRDNACGVIGILTSAVINTSATRLISSLTVENNRAFLIASLDSTGIHVSRFNSILYGTGNITIQNNFCGWVHIATSDVATTEELQATRITGNVLSSQNIFSTTSLLTPYYTVGPNTVDAAILIFSANPTTEQTAVVISDNSIKVSNEFLGYSVAGIWCQTSAIISNNIVRSGAAIGIYLSSGTGPTPWTRNVLVTNNQISRLGLSISAYISVQSATVNDIGIISDNIFDSTTIDGLNTQTVIVPSSGYLVDRNKNQVVSVDVNPYFGNWLIPRSSGEAVTSGYISGKTSSTISNVVIASSPSPSVIVQYFSGDSGIYTVDARFNWAIPLNGLLPLGVTVTKITAAVFTTSGVVTDNLTIHINGASSSAFPITGILTTYSFSPIPGKLIGNGFNYATISLLVTNPAVTADYLIDNVTITYVW